MCAEHQYNFFHIYNDRYQNHCTVVTFQCKLLLRVFFSKKKKSTIYAHIYPRIKPTTLSIQIVNLPASTARRKSTRI